jgi:hypothetical protein
MSPRLGALRFAALPYGTSLLGVLLLGASLLASLPQHTPQLEARRHHASLLASLPYLRHLRLR